MSDPDVGLPGGTPNRDSYERTNELTEKGLAMGGDLSGRNAHASKSASNGQVYLVHWPEAGFYKLGFSVDERRWKPYLSRGGVLVGLAEPTDRHASVVEEEAHGRIRHLPRAFACKSDAAQYLGHNGAGWTECFVAPEGDVLAQLIAIDELAARRRGA